MGERNARLRTARERLPSPRLPGGHMSRADLADAVNAWLWEHTGRRFELDDHLVGKWERGVVRHPIEPYRAALRAVLGVVMDEELGFVHTTPSPAPRGVHRPTSGTWTLADIVDDAASVTELDLINRRSALRLAAVGGTALLGPLAGWAEPLPHAGMQNPVPGTRPLAVRSGALSTSEVEGLEHLVRTFRSWRSAGAGLGRTAVVGQLADVAERLRSAPSGPLTDRAFVAGADLAKIAGSMAFDAGAHHAAQQHYVTAARMAKAGNNNSFGAVALAALARLSFDLEAPDDGLQIVHLAQRGTRSTATPRLRALLATREAWAHAQLGDVRRFRHAAGDAEEEHTTATASGEPPWLHGFDDAELVGTIGARYRDLARHDARQAAAAVDHLSRALQMRDPARARNRAFDLVALGRAQLMTSEPDRAAASVQSALLHVDPHRPTRLHRKLQEWRNEAEPFAAVAVVAETRERVVDVVGRPGVVTA